MICVDGKLVNIYYSDRVTLDYIKLSIIRKPKNGLIVYNYANKEED